MLDKIVVDSGVLLQWAERIVGPLGFGLSCLALWLHHRDGRPRVRIKLGMIPLVGNDRVECEVPVFVVVNHGRVPIHISEVGFVLGPEHRIVMVPDKHINKEGFPRTVDPGSSTRVRMTDSEMDHLERDHAVQKAFARLETGEMFTGKGSDIQRFRAAYRKERNRTRLEGRTEPPVQ